MRIVIAAEHRVVAEALSSLLKMAGHEIVGMVTELDAAQKLVECEQVDACVMDLTMRGAGQRGSIKEVVARAPRTAFIGLADSTDSECIISAVAGGMRGVALKSDDFVEILRVLTGAASARASNRAAGSAVLSLSAQAAGLGSRGRGFPGQERTQPLTQREHEALVRLVGGESTTSIARSMGVRVSTARSHVDAVLTKLNAHSRAQAVALAVREGLVDVDWPTGFGEWGSGESCAVGD
jgi:DNA-binding NarL/FixJ family response regulator